MSLKDKHADSLSQPELRRALQKVELKAPRATGWAERPALQPIPARSRPAVYSAAGR
jgi:hypothetical protein